MSTFKKTLKAIGISLAFMVGYAVVQIMVTILFAVYFSFYSLKMDLSVYPGSNKAEQIMAYTQQNLMMNMALIVLIAGIISAVSFVCAMPRAVQPAALYPGVPEDQLRLVGGQRPGLSAAARHPRRDRQLYRRATAFAGAGAGRDGRGDLRVPDGEA